VSYASAFGDDVATVAPAPAPEPVAARTPPYSRQALAILGITALPWLPPVAGAALGKRFSSEHGVLWGALIGFGISFLGIRQTLKRTGGTIT